MKVALAQVHFFLGDFDKNCSQVINVLKQIKGQVDLVVFPEGGLWGYPPKDFLYQDLYFKVQEKKIKQIRQHLVKGLGLLLPAFIKGKDKLQNGVFFFEQGKKPLFFLKEFLPDQSVFFESRYFEKGSVEKNFFYWKNKRIQILVCEDLWQVSPQKPADLLVAVNASPYTDKKQEKRWNQMKKLSRSYNCPSVYLNCVGGQDSLIFDGGSFVLNKTGKKIWQGAFFKPELKIIDIQKSRRAQTQKKKPSLQEQREQALILGIKDFFYQVGFSQAILGLSGGIDSALTAYLATQALGRKNVQAYFLPGPYTKKISYNIVRQLSKNLDLSVKEQPIGHWLNFASEQMFDKKPTSLTLQNLQARLRTLILMAGSNESKSLLLGTGNKSELATGYCTLYGDLAGALCPIGDLLKTQVYDLAQFVGKKTNIFPKALFLREPSAELAPRQKDSDDLPPYKNLDVLLEKIFQWKSLQSSEEKRWLSLVLSQEFKRFQAPPVLKVSERDLTDSWRMPIAHKFFLKN